VAQLIGLLFAGLAIFITYEVMKVILKIVLFIGGWCAILLSIAFLFTPDHGSSISFEPSIWLAIGGFLALQFIKVFP
jgi:hypothetical protein